MRGVNQYRISNVSSNVSDDILVKELLVPGERVCDVNKVNSLCSDYDAKAILAIPVPKNKVQDHLAWMDSADGEYTKKTGYRFWFKHWNEER